MSNHLAIATVTATLDNVLTQAVGNDVAGVHVTTARPDAAAAGGAARINLFLYQVTPSAAARNADLPTRSSDGKTLMNRPRIGLDLHYLLTFYGDEATFVPQQLLGSTVKTLHARPVLTRKQITDALTAFAATVPALQQNSNLADDIELVKFTQLPLTLEELAKLWSVFFQTTYQLSVAYQGTVVVIETDDSFTSALPVQSRNVYAEPFHPPRIDSVVAFSGDDDSIVTGSKIRVRGERLKGDKTQLSLDGTPPPLAPSSVTDSEIQATLPALSAGLHTLKVEHLYPMGTPLADHPGVESNVGSFVLTPQITGVAKIPAASPNAPDLQITVDPPVTDRQRVSALLNVTDPNRTEAYTFTAVPRAAGVTTNQPLFHSTPIAAGTYFVRIQVDGADSDVVLPDPGTNPKVTIP